MNNKSLLWYRQDLRLQDNEALHEAIRWSSEVIPVYVFDPRSFNARSRFGHRRMHPDRAQFIIEAIHELRKSWQELGSDLIVRIGYPEDVLFQLAQEFKTSVVFCNRERTRDEVSVQDKLERKLWTIGQEMWFARGKMLYYTQDLPFPVTHTPDNFSVFRKELERIVPVRSVLPTPLTLTPIFQAYEQGEIPTMEQLGLKSKEAGSRLFIGGEKEGLKKLKEYIWSDAGLRKFRNKEHSIADPLFSSMLSPWLAQGCLSPKMVYHEIKSYESVHGSNEGTQNMTTELIRRDYCRLIAKKYGDKIFLRGGILQKPVDSPDEEQYLFSLWKEGRLGVPIIDASMIALSASGYLPFPLRNAAAQFLVHTLKVNWQLGADWYEANLMDYDPASNWVNWQSLAKLIPDTTEEKPFSLNFLSKKYDPQGKFIRKWIKALEKIPDSKIFHPELLDDQEQRQYDFIPGKQYPKPIVATQ